MEHSERCRLLSGSGTNGITGGGWGKKSHLLHIRVVMCIIFSGLLFLDSA